MGSFDPTKGVRIAPAWVALTTWLADNGWQHHRTCVDVMLASSDLMRKTCSGLIWKGVRAGLLEQKDTYRGHGDDRRIIRLAGK